MIINHYLYELYFNDNRYIEINNKLLSYLINIMSSFILMNFEVNSYVLKPQKNRSIYTIYSKWANKPPIISIPADDQLIFLKYKRLVGMKTNSWYVIFHARDAQYSPIDEFLQSHRNHSINNFRDSIEYVISQGG
jgi:hypothetical protein